MCILKTINAQIRLTSWMPFWTVSDEADSLGVHLHQSGSLEGDARRLFRQMLL